MADHNEERRPWQEAALETPAKKSGPSVPTEGAARRLDTRDSVILADIDGRPARVVQDLASVDAYTRAVYFEGREDGRAEGLIDGYAAGWKASDDSAELVHREAFRIVRNMAGLPERDVDADRAAARRRADNYGQPVFGDRR